MKDMNTGVKRQKAIKMKEENEVMEKITARMVKFRNIWYIIGTYSKKRRMMG